MINDPTPTFTFGSTDPGSSFRCRIDTAPFKTCTTTYTTPDLSDGPHKISVEAIDAPGNVSVVKGRPFTVDTTAPAVHIDSGPANGSSTQSRYASFQFTTDDPNATITCQLDNDGGFSPCSSPFTNPNPLNDGVHAFQVRARDGAGNVGGAGRLWSVDNIAPTVTVTSGPAEGQESTDPRPSFSFAADESGVTYECHFDSNAPIACSSPFAATSRLSNAQHTFEVVATDRAGNTGAPANVTWTVNAPPVDVRIDGGPAPGSVVKRPHPNLPVQLQRCLGELQMPGRGQQRSRSGCGPRPTGPFTTAHLGDGRHRFTVMAVDGPDSQTASRSFWVDTVGPAATISSGPANGSASSDPSPSFSFSRERGRGAFRVPPGLAQLHRLLLPGCDRAARRRQPRLPRPGGRRGGQRRSGGLEDLRNRHEGPRLRIKGAARVVTAKASVSAAFVLKASEPVRRRCRVDARGFTRCPEHYRTPRLGGGAHTLKVEATDRAGNATTERKRFRIVEKHAGKRHRGAHHRRHR